MKRIGLLVIFLVLVSSLYLVKSSFAGINDEWKECNSQRSYCNDDEHVVNLGSVGTFYCCGASEGNGPFEWKTQECSYCQEVPPPSTCSYSLSIAPSSQTYEDSEKSWSITATDFSTGDGCPSQITYEVSYTRSGSCFNSETYANPSSFTISKGGGKSDAFTVNVKRYGSSCTLNVEVKDPDGNVVATGKYTVKAKSTTPPPSTCSGSISLTLSPSSTSPSSTVTASVSGLSNCNGKTVYIRENSCSGTSVTSCSVSGSGCSSDFNAPPTQGTYSYYACIDKNENGNYDDRGEYDSATLIVTLSDTNPPTGDIFHSPENPTEADIVAFTATGSDAESGLDRIEIYVDDDLKKTCESSPCVYEGGPYTDVGNTHTYYAIIYDKAGNSKTTETKSFIISATPTECHNEPGISVSPTSQEASSPGEELTYTIVITNRDKTDCDASEFELNVFCSSGWTCSLSENSFTLSPQTSRRVYLSVKSPTTFEGTKSIPIVATNVESGKYMNARVEYKYYSDTEPTCREEVTDVWVYPTRVYPGQEVHIFVDFWSPQITTKKSNDKDISLEIKLDEDIWECEINEKLWREFWDMHNCGMEKSECEDENSYFFLEKCHGYAEFVCRMSTTVSYGVHTVNITPFVHSTPTPLRPALAKVEVSTASQSFIYKVVEKIIEGFKRLLGMFAFFSINK
ncbi:MAG: hypothetical protein J7L39_03160 [Candidatus Aenigmarchaeota archaeon]|nr:hypothetical protein [Candidatus Aenigmarchaeota archaeon]